MNFELKTFPPLPQSLQEECRLSINQTPSLVKLSYGDKEFVNSKWDIRQKSYENHLGFNSSEEQYNYIKSRNEKFVTFSIHPTPAAVKDWFVEHVLPLISDEYTLDRISLFVIKDGVVGYPHIDPAPAVFNFMIDISDETVVTRFWKIKEEFKHQQIYTLNIYPFEKLDFVDEVIVPKNTWVFLNVSKLHSIANLNPSKPRIILQVEVTPKTAS